ncbi:hypothetical protein HF292_004830 [Acidithiobacillus ferruginosus]|uniref:Uncharacterized protein n=1 Tax=Acidithiobacillus ferruginosus TaxID=3063951 RepID=A0ACD5ILS6_9PROT|nr:hypothetical protein [Acidithiobacillus ferruginosus]
MKYSGITIAAAIVDGQKCGVTLKLPDQLIGELGAYGSITAINADHDLA